MYQVMYLITISIPPWLISPWGYVIVILFGVEFLTPRLWNLIEYVWWRATLGNSSLGQELRLAAQRDFQLLIEHQITDRGTPRSLAVLLAIPGRITQLPRLTTTLRRRQAGMSAERFESMIEQLNRLWRQGSNPQLLIDYVKEIEQSANDRGIDPELRLQGLCAVAIIKYALGNIVGGNRLGLANWKTAHQLERDHISALKFLASYGFFNSTLFLGHCTRAIELMSTQWSRYYAPLRQEEAQNLRRQLSGKLILNPILAIPRHIILAFALAEIMPLEKRYWPSETAFESINIDDPNLKITWFESWYKVAQDICAVEPISLSFSQAYAGFFLTLMLLDKDTPQSSLHARINEAFNNADASTAIVARYCGFGFRGVYHLICGNDEQAYTELSNAASLSAISGNRFADCIFTCAMAVAAARQNRTNGCHGPEIKQHLAQARRLADTFKSDLFTRLYDAAEAAVCLHRGDKVKAQQYTERSRVGRFESRLLRIFDDDALENRNLVSVSR